MTATNKFIPGKRIKTNHRHYRNNGGELSLRAYARARLESVPSPDELKMLTTWAGGKLAA